MNIFIKFFRHIYRFDSFFLLLQQLLSKLQRIITKSHIYMRKLYLIVCLLAVCGLCATAKQRTEAEKAAVATSMLQKKAAKTRVASEALKTLKTAEAYTIMGYGEGGFVVVSNDDEYNAVVAYSDTPYTGKNPAFEMFLAAANRAMTEGIAQNTTTKNLPANVKDKVEPLLKTKWDQESPYYNKCPKVNNKYCLTGCVATAMAQVMKYYEYPSGPTGSATYTDPATNNQKTIKFAGVYDWDKMLDTYTGNETTSQKNAVATLMFHCGASADMSYGTSGSGTYLKSALTGIINNFGYKAKYYGYRQDYEWYGEGDDYDYNKWYNSIYMEISDGHPVIYSANSYKNTSDWSGAFAHCFVLDGYDANGLVHVNWGWSGDADGYVALETLPCAKYNYTFAYFQDMIMMRPDSEVPYDLVKGTPITGIETVNNTAKGDGMVRVYDTMGREVYASPEASFNTKDINAKGVLIIRNGKQSRKIIK